MNYNYDAGLIWYIKALSQPVLPEENRQMSINVTQKIVSHEKWKILTHLQNMPKNVGDLGTLIVAKGFKKCPKSKNLPNLVTLLTTDSFREE